MHSKIGLNCIRNHNTYIIIEMLCMLLNALKYVSHLLLNGKSKACWLIKSSVLDSTVLRERHKISIKRTLLSLLFSVPQQWFYGKVKNPDKDKTI